MKREEFQEIFERLRNRKPSEDEVSMYAKLPLAVNATENEIRTRAGGPANVDLLFLILHSPALREPSWTLLSNRKLSFSDYMVILEAPLHRLFHQRVWKKMKAKLSDELNNPKLKHVAVYAWNSEIQHEARMLLTCPDTPSISTDHFPDTTTAAQPIPAPATITPPIAPYVPIFHRSPAPPRRSARPTAPCLTLSIGAA